MSDRASNVNRAVLALLQKATTVDDLITFIGAFYCLFPLHDLESSLRTLVSEADAKNAKSISLLCDAWVQSFSCASYQACLTTPVPTSNKTADAQPQATGPYKVTFSALADFIIQAGNTVWKDQQTLNQKKLLLLKNKQNTKKLKADKKKISKFTIPQNVDDVNHLQTSTLFQTLSGFSVDKTTGYLCNLMRSFICSLELDEFANCKWMKSTKREVAPTISKAIDFFNFVSFRVSSDIIIQESATQRAEIIQKAIDMGKKARELCNYDVLAAIVAGLNSCACSQARLKKSWMMVSKKHMQTFDELDELVTPLSNYGTYRAALANHLEQGDTLFVPMLSVILRDVASADASYSNTNDGGFNIDKPLMIGKALYPILYLKVCNSEILGSSADSKPKRMRRSSTLHVETANQTATQPEFTTFIDFLKIYPPASEDLQQKLSYAREPPKNAMLNLEEDQEEQELEPVYRSNTDPTLSSSPGAASSSNHLKLRILEKSFDEMSTRERIEILRRAAAKPTHLWNEFEVRVSLESWGLPEDVCKQLVFNGPITSGAKLIEIAESHEQLKGAVKVLGYRKLIQRQVKVLKGHQLLISTYGAASASAQVRNFSTAVKRQPLSTWTVNEVVNWISTLSELSAYATLFDEKQIDGKKLVDMISSDLLAIGIKVMRHRKMLLQSVSSLQERRDSLTAVPSHAAQFKRKSIACSGPAALARTPTY